MKKGNLMISNDGFSLEGKPLRILSGAIHYFRVPRDYWKDRLAKLHACGFNTVETYIPGTCMSRRKAFLNGRTKGTSPPLRCWRSGWDCT